MRKISYLAIFVLALCSCAQRQSETFLERELDRAILMDDFASYSSVEEIRSMPAFNSGWTVIENSNLVAGDQRPPFNDFRVTVPRYRHLGCDGELMLEFFNDRLQSVWFYPDDANAYRAELKKAGVTVSDGVPSILDDWVWWQPTSVWSTVDYRNRQYVAWSDKRLSQQMHRWVERYA